LSRNTLFLAFVGRVRRVFLRRNSTKNGYEMLGYATLTRPTSTQNFTGNQSTWWYSSLPTHNLSAFF